MARIRCLTAFPSLILIVDGQHHVVEDKFCWITTALPEVPVYHVREAMAAILDHLDRDLIPRLKVERRIREALGLIREHREYLRDIREDDNLDIGATLSLWHWIARRVDVPSREDCEDLARSMYREEWIRHGTRFCDDVQTLDSICSDPLAMFDLIRPRFQRELGLDVDMDGDGLRAHPFNMA
jgi:hypothetical protein